MSFTLGGLVLEYLIIHSPEEKKALEKEGKPVPAARRESNLTEKMILLALSSFANRDGGNIYPSRKVLASLAGGCSIRTIERALDKFLDDGVLTYADPVDKHGHVVRRRTRCYRIDVIKAIELYSECAPKEDIMSFIKKDSVSHGEKTKRDNGVRTKDSVSHDEGHGVTESLNRTLDPSARAGEPPDGGPADPSPACQVWKDHWPEIEAAFEPKDLAGWIDGCCPESDDGITLTLAVPTRFHADYVRSSYLPTLERIVGRKICLQVRSWASQRFEKIQIKRKQEKGAAA